MDILTNVFFWLFAGGTLGALLAIRTARRFQEKAAFAEYPEDQDRFEFRSRIFYVVFAIFLLAGLSGLGISGFQFFSARGGVALPPLLAQEVDPTSSPPDFLTEEPPATTPEAAETTPAATQTASEPPATPEPTHPPGVAGVRVIGNTNYQGVNVRERPTLDAPILAKLANGSEVLLFDTPGQEADGFTWLRVQLEGGATGWVVESFLLEEPLDFNP